MQQTETFLVDNFIVHLSESETVVHLLHHICLYVQPSSGILSSPSSLLYDDSSTGLKQYGGNTHHSLTSPHISTVRMVNRASTGSSGVTACWAALHGCLDVHYLWRISPHQQGGVPVLFENATVGWTADSCTFFNLLALSAYNQSMMGK